MLIQCSPVIILQDLRSPPKQQDAHARRRHAEALLDLQSKLLRAATRLERERVSQEERREELVSCFREEMVLCLDSAEREAMQLDSRTQRLLALQDEWKEEAERGEAAQQNLKQARRELKEREVQIEELHSKDDNTSLRLRQTEERNRELEAQLRSAERTREELLSLQDDLRREASDVQLRLQDARDRGEESTRELDHARVQVSFAP
jgi:chromosome segregation ATPase